MRPDRVRHALLATVAVTMLVTTACSDSESDSESIGIDGPVPGPSNVDGPIELDTMVAGGTAYALGLAPNQQGFDAPCVGLSFSDTGASHSSMACPMDESEADEYASTIEAGERFFIVGYGLADGETVMTGAARQVLVANDADGRLYFAIELAARPGSGPVPLTVTAPSGETRTIAAFGHSG